MSDFDSESETELLVLKDGRRFKYDDDYFSGRNRRHLKKSSWSMGSILKTCFCGWVSFFPQNLVNNSELCQKSKQIDKKEVAMIRKWFDFFEMEPRIIENTAMFYQFSVYSYNFGKHQLSGSSKIHVLHALVQCLSLSWWPLPLSCWCLSDERLPRLPAEHFAGQDELLLGLQDQLLGLSVVDGLFKCLHVFVLEWEIFCRIQLNF